MTQVRRELATQLSRKIYYNGMTKTAMAKKTGISRATIVNILNGNHSVSLENYLSICEALKISPQRFLKDILEYKKFLEVSATEEPDEKKRDELNLVLKKALGGKDE